MHKRKPFREERKNFASEKKRAPKEKRRVSLKKRPKFGVPQGEDFLKGSFGGPTPQKFSWGIGDNPWR